MNIFREISSSVDCDFSPRDDLSPRNDVMKDLKENMATPR